jgi:hypothetical protein
MGVDSQASNGAVRLPTYAIRPIGNEITRIAGATSRLLESCRCESAANLLPHAPPPKISLAVANPETVPLSSSG